MPRPLFSSLTVATCHLKNKNWRVPYLEGRVKTEGVSKSEDIEKNPTADFHPGTNQA
jgi:hypothetical protein